MAATHIKSILDLAYMVYPHLRNQIDHISSMPLATRSVLIKCCQAQAVPPGNTPLGRMVNKLRPYYITTKLHPEEHNPFMSFRDMQPLISGPVTSAILLDLCRALPISLNEVMEAREASWKKEGVKIEESSRECKINWAPIFDLSRCNEPLLDFLPPNPSMNKYIHAGLHLWKKRLVDRVLLPRYTRKNMSRDTRRAYEAESGISLENTPIFSQEDYLRYYHETGIPLGGATEMRQKWYASGVKPRTYFAQGGHHYQHSAHLQDVFTMLVNTMSFTHHITRLLPSRLRLPVGSHYRIYDLSTFTSNMAEQRGFVWSLKEFCYGTRVYTFDVSKGLEERDLGDLMQSYYDECVMRPIVSYERVPGVQRDMEETYISDHGVASMLGIFGNLMTCTFAHGCLMAQTVDSEDLLNVAGDDGAVEETDRNREEIRWCIETLGECEMTKTFLSSDEGCICLKRPLSETIGGLTHGRACIPPSLVTMAHYCFGVTDIRYTFHNDIVCQPSSYSIVGKDLMRFLRSVHRAAPDLDDVQLSYSIQVASRWTKAALGFEDYYDGRLPHCGDPFFWPPIPTLEDYRSGFDPLDRLIIKRFNGVATLPVLSEGEREYAELSGDVEVGDVLRGCSTWRMAMACALGYCRRENLSRVVFGLEAFNAIKHILVDFEPHVYEFHVVRHIPWMLL